MLSIVPREMLLCILDRIDYRSAAILEYTNKSISGAVKRHMKLRPKLKFLYVRFWRCMVPANNTEIIKVQIDLALFSQQENAKPQCIQLHCEFGNKFKDEECLSVEEIAQEVFDSFGKSSTSTRIDYSDGSWSPKPVFKFKCKDDTENYEQFFKFYEMVFSYMEIQSFSVYYFKYVHALRLNDAISRHCTRVRHFSTQSFDARPEADVGEFYELAKLRKRRTVHFYVRENFELEKLFDPLWKEYEILSLHLERNDVDMSAILSKAHARRLSIFMKRSLEFAYEKLQATIKHVYSHGLANIDCLVQGFHCPTTVDDDIYNKLIALIDEASVQERRRKEGSNIEEVDFTMKDTDELLQLHIKRSGINREWVMVKLCRNGYKKPEVELEYYYRYWDDHI